MSCEEKRVKDLFSKLQQRNITNEERREILSAALREEREMALEEAAKLSDAIDRANYDCDPADPSSTGNQIRSLKDKREG